MTAFNYLHMDILVPIVTYGYLLVALCLSLSSVAIVGVFSSLQKKELVGDVIAHSFLPGLVCAYMLTGTRGILPLMMGAFGSGLLALFLVNTFLRHLKVKEDTAMAFVLATFSGVGFFMLSHLQHSSNGEGHAGIDRFLWGNVASLQQRELHLFVVVCLLLLVTLFFLFKEWVLLSFDPIFAQTVGIPYHKLQALFELITIWTVILASQSVGIVLMTSILVVPALTARFWCNGLMAMLVTAACSASFAGVVGVILSYRMEGLPTGSSIVLIITLMGIFSAFFSPRKGWFAQQWTRRAFCKRVRAENLLKAFYELGLQGRDYFTPRHYEELHSHRPIPHLRRTLKDLCGQGLIQKVSEGRWTLTKRGKEGGANLLHKHLLWEQYLCRHLSASPTEVHFDAEAIEHVITPEIEHLLEQSLREKKTITPSQPPSPEGVPPAG